MSAAFAEYLEAIAALTGSPFRWGALAWRLPGKGGLLRSRHDNAGGIGDDMKPALSLPATSARASRIRIERDRFPGALDGLGDRATRVGSTDHGRARDAHEP